MTNGIQSNWFNWKCEYIDIYATQCINARAWVRAYVCVCVFVHKYICTCVRVSVCAYVCVSICYACKCMWKHSCFNHIQPIACTFGWACCYARYSERKERVHVHIGRWCTSNAQGPGRLVLACESHPMRMYERLEWQDVNLTFQKNIRRVACL